MRSQITDVRLTPVLIADPPLLNIAGVHQPYAPRLIVEIETDSGFVGLGETYGDGAYLKLASSLAAQLKGRPVGEINAIRRIGREDTAGNQIVDPNPDASGYRGLLTTEKMRLSVISAFEGAALDAYGRQLGIPVHALLGGKVRDRVEYAGYLFYKWGGHPGEPVDEWGEVIDPAGVVELARKFVERCGSRSFKLKGGAFPAAEEVAAIKALAAAFPGRPVRLDPNGAWSLETATRVAEELTGVVEYLEDPTARAEDMAEVHRRTGMPLATNMIVTAIEEVKPAFDVDAVQVVLSDHHFWGGLLATRDLAAVCRAYGRGVSMHSNTHLGISLASMTQVAATVPDLDYACDTHYPWQPEDVITRPFEFKEGAIDVTDTPGLGVELDRDSLARLHERWLNLPEMRERDDIAAMRAVHPDYQRPALPKY